MIIGRGGGYRFYGRSAIYAIMGDMCNVYWINYGIVSSIYKKTS